MLLNETDDAALDNYAQQAYDVLKNVNDPSIQAFIMTFATEFDPEQTLANIMMDGSQEYFEILDQVTQKIAKFK